MGTRKIVPMWCYTLKIINLPTIIVSLVQNDGEYPFVIQCRIYTQSVLLNTFINNVCLFTGALNLHSSSWRLCFKFLFCFLCCEYTLTNNINNHSINSKWIEYFRNKEWERKHWIIELIFQKKIIRAANVHSFIRFLVRPEFAIHDDSFMKNREIV